MLKDEIQTKIFLISYNSKIPLNFLISLYVIDELKFFQNTFPFLNISFSSSYKSLR